MTGSRVHLSWTSIEGASGYLLRAGSAPGLSNAASVTSTGTTLNATAATGRNHVRVSAQSACTESTASNEVVLAVGEPAPLPGPPSNLTANVNGTTVRLAWTAPSSGGQATGYVLEVGSGQSLADLGTLAVGFTAAGVPPRAYYVRVRAANAAGVGTPSPDVLVLVR